MKEEEKIMNDPRIQYLEERKEMGTKKSLTGTLQLGSIPATFSPSISFSFSPL